MACQNLRKKNYKLSLLGWIPGLWLVKRGEQSCALLVNLVLKCSLIRDAGMWHAHLGKGGWGGL